VAPSRFADATASDGIKAEAGGRLGGTGVGVGDTGGGGVLPDIVLNVVFATGHMPLLVHDLKWIVCMPAPMDTFVASIS
jgi:hypothetical protein